MIKGDWFLFCVRVVASSNEKSWNILIRENKNERNNIWHYYTFIKLLYIWANEYGINLKKKISLVKMQYLKKNRTSIVQKKSYELESNKDQIQA